MRLARTPKAVQRAFPNLTWSTDVRQAVYLTFDDGPTPGVTDQVLDILDDHDARATFFCLGKNVVHHPVLFDRIRRAGHAVGNHTYNHLNGWETPPSRYLSDVESCHRIFYSTLFRPPYGKVRPSQRKRILEHYRIVMWDVLSYDFDTALTPEGCLRTVLKHVRPGSIVVFHDSEKAAERMLYCLPRILDHFGRQGLAFRPLD